MLLLGNCTVATYVVSLIENDLGQWPTINNVPFSHLHISKRTKCAYMLLGGSLADLAYHPKKYCKHGSHPIVCC